MIKEISPNNLLETLKILSDASKNIKSLIEVIGGNAEDVYGGINLVRDLKIYSVFIKIKENKVIHIEFTGRMDIYFSTLQKEFGEFKKIYVAYDDLYYYLFNQNSEQTPYFVSTHLLSNIDPVVENNLLWNLTLFIQETK